MYTGRYNRNINKNNRQTNTTMNTHTTEQLLMCEKTDLVKYIEELRGDVEGWKASRDDDIREAEGSMRDELEELKEHNEMFDEDITYKMNELKELKKENEELKKRGEESLQLTMSQNEKFMDELEEKNKVIDTLKEEHHSVWVKLKNANELYKGYACGVLTEKINTDIEILNYEQTDISAGTWLSKFLQETFYQEIVPELINEITEDGLYGFGGGGDMYELEHNGKGCISITEVERSSSDNEDDDE